MMNGVPGCSGCSDFYQFPDRNAIGTPDTGHFPQKTSPHVRQGVPISKSSPAGSCVEWHVCESTSDQPLEDPQFYCWNWHCLPSLHHQAP